MIIECPSCEAKVDAKVLAEHEYPPSDFSDPHKIVFLLCTICESTMVGFSEPIQVDYDKWDWSNPSRLWPKPPERFKREIPPLVRRSLEEAKKCFRAKAFSACAVMCGRALEGICTLHTKKKNLASGLKELKENKIIDNRLYEWGEALRKERNIGAHASEEETNQEDAQDLLDFVTAICEYIFVLSKKYENYVKRKVSKI